MRTNQRILCGLMAAALVAAAGGCIRKVPAPVRCPGCGVAAHAVWEPCPVHAAEYGDEEFVPSAEDYQVSLVARPRTDNAPPARILRKRELVAVPRREMVAPEPVQYQEQEEAEELTFRIPVSEAVPLAVIAETPVPAKDEIRMGGALPIPQTAVTTTPQPRPQPTPLPVAPSIPTPVPAQPPRVPGTVHNLPPAVQTAAPLAPTETNYGQ